MKRRLTTITTIAGVVTAFALLITVGLLAQLPDHPPLAPVVLHGGGGWTWIPAVTKAVSFSGPRLSGMAKFDTLIFTLDVTSAERDSANETYDFYITGGDGVSEWDLVHFPQIATTGAKRYTALVIAGIGGLPQEVTTATPGVAAVTTGTFKTDTGGSNEGIKTLAAGKVRQGMIGDTIGYELVEAGTIVTGIAYSITVTAR
jgi:hypothetical protein